MYKLPAYLIKYISSFLSIDNLLSFSKSKINGIPLIKAVWFDIFKFVYPIIPMSRDNNYIDEFGKYYDIFSYTETIEPINKSFIQGNEEIIQFLHDVGADIIGSYPFGGFKPTVKPDVFILPFVDLSYYFGNIYFISNFITFMADELPDIKSGKIFPTGVYIKRSLKNGDIDKLYNKFDKSILLKWLILDIDYIGISPNDIIAPSSKLIKLLIKSFDEIIEYLGDILFNNDYYFGYFVYLFDIDYITQVKIYAHQLNIKGINKIKDKINYSNIDDEFTRDVLKMVDNIERYIVNHYDPEMESMCEALSNTQDYKYIKPIVYKLFYKYPDHIYRAVVFSILDKRNKYSLLPIKLDISENIYEYLIGNIELLEMVNEPELLKLVLTIQYYYSKLDDFTEIDYRYKFYNRIPGDLINHIYRNNISKTIETISDIVKLYGNLIEFDKVEDVVLNKMDFITSLSLMNNFHNVLNYVNTCIDRDINNEILRNIISRPECYGMLLDSWPKSKKYIDMNILYRSIDLYKAARRSANIYVNIILPDKIDGLLYLLNKLLPDKDEVDRFLVRIFRNYFTDYFPDHKLNINYIISDSIAIRHLINSKYSFGDIYKIIEDNIDVYPLSCRYLLNILLDDKTEDSMKILDNYFRTLGFNGVFIFHDYLLSRYNFNKDKLNSLLGYKVYLKQKPIMYELNILTENVLRSEFAGST